MKINAVRMSTMRGLPVAMTGFSLIELIALIVILGILAAMALPKFINIGSDARIATINGLSGAVRAADQLVSSAALVKGLNNVQSTTYPNGVPNSTDPNAIMLWCGHPDTQFAGIASALSGASFSQKVGNGSFRFGDFNVVVTSSNVSWQHTLAPTPSSCKVDYAYNPGWPSCGQGTILVPDIKLTTTGC